MSDLISRKAQANAVLTIARQTKRAIPLLAESDKQARREFVERLRSAGQGSMAEDSI